MQEGWQQEREVVLNEKAQLCNRNKKYEVITSTLLFAASLHPFSLPFYRVRGVAPGVATAYFFCRCIDDVADGDREVPSEYFSYQNMDTSLRTAMYDGVYRNTPFEILLQGMVRDYQDFYHVDVRPITEAFLDAMLVEWKRRSNRETSTGKELFDVYQNSFGVPQDLAFIAFNARIRSSDVPELAQLQGRMYAIRDLEEDQEKGIHFVPNHITDIDAWKREEAAWGRETIKQIKQKELGLSGRLVTSFLTKGIEHFLNNNY